MDQLQDAIVRGYDKLGRPVADLASVPRDTSVHAPRDPDADPTTPEQWEAMVERPELSYVRRGGRSASVGVAKPLVIVIQLPRPIGPEAADGGRFRVQLTRGEAEYYLSRRETAQRVIAEYIEALKNGGAIAAITRRRGDRLVDVDIYGVPTTHAEVLRADPGSARAILSAYAREQDGRRIQVRDAWFRKERAKS